MKSLVERLNEALGDVTPKQFMDIWKGKNVSIDTDTVNNVAYFSNEMCNVHRSKLPTPEEFTNVCKWIIDNTSWTKKDGEKFLIKIMETYLQTTDIADTAEFVKYGPNDIKIIKYGRGVNLFKDDLTLNFAAITFFNKHYFESKSDSKVIDVYKDRITPMFEPAFKKYNVSWDNWPDYSEGFNMLERHFN
jgi:hypothetical protein